MQKEPNVLQNGSKAKVYDKEQLKKRLTPLQYRVTQDKVTERPFSGEYVKLNDNGMYACVVCNEELFSSSDKYDSGCGWPAFNNVIDNSKVKLAVDLSHVGTNLLLLAFKTDMARTEVTCANCNAHLGHLFDDGPKPSGKRFCINSAALRFQRSNSVQIKKDNIKTEDILKAPYSVNIKSTNGTGHCEKTNFNGTKRTLMETHL